MTGWYSGSLPKDETLTGRGTVHGFRRFSHYHRIYAVEAKRDGRGYILLQLHSQRSKNAHGRGGTIMTLTETEAQAMMKALRAVMVRPPMLVEL